jgi:hypothetical protein
MGLNITGIEPAIQTIHHFTLASAFNAGDDNDQRAGAFSQSLLQLQHPVMQLLFGLSEFLFGDSATQLGSFKHGSAPFGVRFLQDERTTLTESAKPVAAFYYDR